MKTLPDYLRKGMKLVSVGLQSNGSLRSAPAITTPAAAIRSGLCSMTAASFPNRSITRTTRRIIEFGIGLTDLVKRPTKTIEELKREDYAEGRFVLSRKLEEYLPRVIAFNGKLPFEQFRPAQVQLRDSERTSLRRACLCIADNDSGYLAGQK